MEPLINDVSPISSILLCVLLAFIYVGSLYIWKDKKRSDHPDVIKKRFISITLVNIIAPFIVYYGTNFTYFKDASLLDVLGLRMTGTIAAFIIPLVLTMILFLGPLVMSYKEGGWCIYLEPRYWLLQFTNLLWLRNHIVAPLSEEFIFRASMLPLLVPQFGMFKAIFICPFLFGIAHFHHLIEKLWLGVDYKVAILNALFQFTYTTIFGIYSSFLFLRTGHIIAPFIAHAFCNHIGFPDFYKFSYYQPKEKMCLSLAFIAGLVLWLCLLFPLTQSQFYSNTIYS